MKMPLIAVAIVVLAAAFAARGQYAGSPTQLVRPVLKDPDHRYAPTSLNQDPDRQRSQNANQNAQRPAAPPAAAQPPQPSIIVAKIDPGLKASKIATIGTVKGIKGSVYVTNTGALPVTPVVRMAVCDDKGVKIGVASKTGEELAPNASEKIAVLATNFNAIELRLLQLTTTDAK
jgi:hypothetical protein